MKSVITIVLIIILFAVVAVCFSRAEPITLEKDCINIVKLSFSAFEEGDFAALAELYSPDYLQHSPDFKDPQTWSEYELACRIVHAHIPDLQYRIVDIFACNDKVAVRSIWEFPVDPSWSKYRMSSIVTEGTAISIFRIEDGKIIEEWCEYDPVIIKRFCTFYRRMEHMK